MQSCLLFTLISLFLGAGSPPGIVIDGRFDDWQGIEPALIDPIDAAGEAIDLRDIFVTSDGRFVHLLVDFGRTVNIQQSDVAVHLLLDVDGNESTGRNTFGLSGTDLDIILSPTDRDGGVALVSTTRNASLLNPYDIGFTFGPTYASRRFEFRIERGVRLDRIPAVFIGRQLRGKMICLDAQQRIVDQSDVFDYELAPLDVTDRAITAPLPANFPGAEAGAGALRVMSWNTADGALIRKPEAFARVLVAIDPDVIFLQELTDRNSASQLESFLNQRLSTETSNQWHVAFGEGGGNLRCAVASKLPLESVEPFELLPYPDWPDRSLRVAGAVIKTADQRLLCVSLHLRCCGGIGSKQDFIRILEAETIREELRKLVESASIDGVIVAGDFNLIGSRRPLDLLTTQLDVTALSLAETEPYQLDGLSNATWSDRKQSFVPGRLDYLLYSITQFQVRGAFVFDSADLAPQSLLSHGLQAEDTASASDHLPLVVDLEWTEPHR